MLWRFILKAPFLIVTEARSQSSARDFQISNTSDIFSEIYVAKHLAWTRLQYCCQLFTIYKSIVGRLFVTESCFFSRKSNIQSRSIFQRDFSTKLFDVKIITSSAKQ